MTVMFITGDAVLIRILEHGLRGLVAPIDAKSGHWARKGICLSCGTFRTDALAASVISLVTS